MCSVGVLCHLCGCVICGVGVLCVCAVCGVVCYMWCGCVLYVV